MSQKKKFTIASTVGVVVFAGALILTRLVSPSQAAQDSTTPVQALEKPHVLERLAEAAPAAHKSITQGTAPSFVLDPAWPIHVAPQTAYGTSGTVNFSTDAKQSCLYVGDLSNDVVYEMNRQNLQEMGRFSGGGRQAGEFHWPHVVSVDSEGTSMWARWTAPREFRNFCALEQPGATEPEAPRSANTSIREVACS